MIGSIAPTLPFGAAALVLVPALAPGVAALIVARSTSVSAAWRTARAASTAVVAATTATLVVRVAAGPRAGSMLRLDNVTVAMLCLIALVGWAVLRFSAAYLAGDPHERRYLARMLATLGAVSMVVVANDVVLLVVAWTAASIALHGLLVFFADRPAAVAVAHKKFLLARCADACMIGAVVAFGSTFHTLRIDGIGTAAVAAPTLPAGARLGVLLVSLAAVLKCAQVPFHGWLIQVMEAPTPVSALLHAGVVNLGGFVLIRFAPVVDRAVETRTLLVVIGVVTAVLASLVMTTRVSIKVALAWSTCAQMGFMLIQCGLGLWPMALLHLLAHSVYKAHAFLGAGSTVRQTQRRQLAVRLPAPSTGSIAAGAAIALATTVVVGAVWEALPGTTKLSAGVWLMSGVVALALVPLTTPRRAGRGAPFDVRAVAVPIAYFGLHEVARRVVPDGATAPTVLLLLTGTAFAALFVAQAAFVAAPGGPLIRRIRPWVYAGLFLDDVVTSAAFAVAPPPAPVPRIGPLPVPPVHAVLGERAPSVASF